MTGSGSNVDSRYAFVVLSITVGPSRAGDIGSGMDHKLKMKE